MRIEKLENCILCRSERIRVIDKRSSICRCEGCGHVFDNPRPTFDEIRDFYSASCTYDQWLLRERQRDGMWEKRLKMIKKVWESGSLLDVGAGTGQFLKFAGEAYQVTGTEISKKAIDIAERLYDIELLSGSLETIDFGDEKFDIITAFHVLEHVPDPAFFIDRCYQLLKDKGILVIAVPNDIHSLAAQIKKILALLKVGRWKYRGLSGLPNIALEGIRGEIHLSHFKTSVLTKRLVDSSFKIEEVKLDPYNASAGFEKVVQDSYYFLCWGIQRLFRLNLYDTIWIVGSKNMS